MKTPVPDAAVHEYVAKIRNGLPTGNVFPCSMTDCEFTVAQRKMIKQARADVRATRKNGGASMTPSVRGNQSGSTNTFISQAVPITDAKGASAKPAVARAAKPHKGLTKLRKLLYLQSDRCFFCGELLKEEDASIEHLNPKSRGGASSEDNEVVCHKSLNQVFGGMDLKTKFSFVLKSKGTFKCPKV